MWEAAAVIARRRANTVVIRRTNWSRSVDSNRPTVWKWETEQDCGTQGGRCSDDGTGPACLSDGTCSDGVQNQDETGVDCGGHCDPCPIGEGCVDDSDCGSGACSNGICVLCHAGGYRCWGNYLQRCTNDESDWEDVDHCDVLSSQVCDVQTGTCHESVPVGGTTVTGVYYQYSSFCVEDGVFKGGFDVGSAGDFLFVNRSGRHIDVYHVALADSDGDGVADPNQNPDNPDDQGPIEERTLEFVRTYDGDLASHDYGPCGVSFWGANEIQPRPDAIYFISQAKNSLGLVSYDPNSNQRNFL